MLLKREVGSGEGIGDLNGHWMECTFRHVPDIKGGSVENGMVGLWKYKRERYKTWYERFVGLAIVFFTGKDFVHAVIYFDGKTYESTVWKEGKEWKNGIRVTDGILNADEFLTPKRSLTVEETVAMRAFLNWVQWINYKYNFLKLLALSLVYPTRWFWNLIGWVPFSNQVFGGVCSEFIDEVYDFITWDIIPNQNKEYTCPGDIWESESFNHGAILDISEIHYS